ncbi:MAG: hypothetical protein HETSPECPRED_009442 [Heterodermia speciosa]|uniref:WSC domain-containing protein n=1 Tax=Heterodermia speciosa TaxID=116794 RepID=A0A8H3IV87_9LECA|nr:MAG: hypothetical protein HETSPECPRED_009442 [Heterodermia speciosa]
MPSLVNTLFLATVATALFSLSATALVIERNPVYTLPLCSVPFTPFLYAGCYSDTSSPRTLPFAPAGLDTQHMTVEQCVAECKGNGYRYAGLKYYGECFCGDSVSGPQLSDDQCRYPCTGNKSEVCGGSDIPFSSRSTSSDGMR